MSEDRVKRLERKLKCLEKEIKCMKCKRGKKGLKGKEGNKGEEGEQGEKGDRGRRGPPGVVDPCELEEIDEVEETDEILIVRDCVLYRIDVEDFCDFCITSGGLAETAWSKDPNNEFSRCFSTFNELNSNRWGWSNGPYNRGDETTHEIWAAAGQCDTSKGFLAGTLDIEFVADRALLSISLNIGFSIVGVIAMYVGNSPLFLKPNNQPTVAPGQLPCKIPSQDAGSFECEYTVYDDMGPNIFTYLHVNIALP